MATGRSFGSNATGWLSCRAVLSLMVMLGFMLNYALRVNLTIAIVAMVKSTVNRTSDTPNITVDHQNRFEWDTYQQNTLFGSFFWGYILTEIPGGRLAEILGSKRVFGYSMLVASLLTLLNPVGAYLSYGTLLALRVLNGLCLGATWPAIYPMIAKWIPPMDRSRFMSNMMASALGAAITMPISGVLIDSFGWESVFYFTGAIGVIWSVVWFVVIFDSPGQHPRISTEEKEHIEKAIGDLTNAKSHSKVPWCSILTSVPVWAIIITHGMSVYGYHTAVTQLPTYMKTILHYDIKSNGLLSSLPYLGKYIFALLTSFLADYLRKSGKLTTTQTRKTFTTFAIGIPSLLMVAQVYLGHDRVWSVVLFTVGLTINGGVTAGYLGNGLDIAPNFSGTIFGMANTLSSIGGYLSTFMVAVITHENQTYEAWQIVFWILSGTYACGALVFLIFGSGELQPWNGKDSVQKVIVNGNGHRNDNSPEEQVPLRNTTEQP